MRQRKSSLACIQFDNILVMCLGGFGDTIMATPLCQAVRRRYPNAAITALTMWQTSTALLSKLSVFDKIISHNFLTSDLGSSLHQIWQLRRQAFDLSVLTFPANRAHYNLLAWTIHARHRLGHNYLVGSSLTYCRFLLTHRLVQEQATHNVEENMKLVRCLGASGDTPTLSAGTLGLDQADWADKFLASKPPPYFGIHPGCSSIKNHVNRRWPAENYGALADTLMHKTGGTALVFVGPDELNLLEPIVSNAPSATLVVRTSIDRIAALIRQCQVVVCSDSGLGHLAGACGVPVVSVVGPTNPNYTKPWGVPHRIVSGQKACSPCFEVSRRPLQCDKGLAFACVRDIPIAGVLDATMSLFNETNKDSSTTLKSAKTPYPEAKPEPAKRCVC
jgi:heptosyltransferase-2